MVLYVIVSSVQIDMFKHDFKNDVCIFLNSLEHYASHCEQAQKPQ